MVDGGDSSVGDVVAIDAADVVVILLLLFNTSQPSIKNYVV